MINEDSLDRNTTNFYLHSEANEVNERLPNNTKTELYHK
jgi:hypothetical protein